MIPTIISFKQQWGCYLLLLFCLLCFPCFVYAQSGAIVKKKDYETHLAVSFESGYVLKSGVASGDSLLSSSKYVGFDIQYGWRRRTADLYSTLYRYPVSGVGFYFSSFDNKLGNISSLYYFVTTPFSGGTHKLKLSYTLGFGVAYLSATNGNDNLQNIFIASHINASVYVGLALQYKFTNHWQASATIGFRHFSNGSYKLPNMGLNVIPLSVGLQYTFTKKPFTPEKAIVPDYTDHNIISVFAAAGSKNYVSGEHNYLKTTLGVYYLRQLSYKYRVGLGFDIFYSAGAENRTTNHASAFSNSMSFGIVPTWEWALQKRLCIAMSLGVYVHRNTFNDEVKPYYLRLGFRYCITPHIYTGLSIKAHNNQSDFFEWTVGYKFHRDPNKY